MAKNKHIKLLLEALFDDFDEIYADDDILIDTNEIFTKNEHIVDCVTKEELVQFIIEKFDLEKQFINKVQEYFDYYQGEAHYLDQLNREHIRLEFGTSGLSTYVQLSTDNYDDEDLIYRNKVMKPKVVTLNNSFLLCINYSGEKYSLNDKLKAVYNQKNEELRQSLYNNAKAFLRDIVDQEIGADYLIQEISYEGKVYPVKQKDIDRMTKCIETGNFAGFDAITKVEKMAARLAAFFIVAKKMGYNKYELKLTDGDFLYLGWNRNKGKYRSSNTGYHSNSYYRRGVTRTSLDDYVQDENTNHRPIIEILLKINNDIFKDKLHLNDIIATYLKYKDQF